jgi:hypothetical protein
MFFALRVNNSLALLGLDPRTVKAEYRQTAQLMGKAVGASPQEIALFIAGQLPIAYRMGLSPRAAVGWIRKRKVNPRNPNVREALMILGWDELADY